MGKIKKVNRPADESLLLAASGYESEPVRKALSQGANIEARPDGRWLVGNKTPLIIASWHGREETVKLLIERGADLDAKDEWGATPLIAASVGGFVSIVELLLRSGAKVNEVDNQKATALMHAIWVGRLGVVKALIRGGADLYVENEAGRTVLDYTSRDAIKEVLNEYAQELKKQENQFAIEKRQIGASNHAESVEEIIRELEREG